jgi:hypothetical protein
MAAGAVGFNMVQTMSASNLSRILLGILGAAMALFAWASVVFRKIPVTWKGGNHALLSMPSRVAMAVAMTSWCLALTGFHPMIWVALFAVCVMFGMIHSRRDRVAHDAGQGITEGKLPMHNPRLVWRVLCAYDALLLAAFLFAIIRDMRHRPVTEEQHDIHVMAIGGLVIAVLGAVSLYVKRPTKEARKESKKSQASLP